MGSQLNKHKDQSVLSKKNEKKGKRANAELKIKEKPKMPTKECGTMTEPENANKAMESETRINCTYVKPRRLSDA